MSDNKILSKLEGISFRHEEVAKLIVDPEIISDMKRYVKLNREYKDLEPIVESYKLYKNILSNIDSSKDIIKNEEDEEFKEMAKLELEELLNDKDSVEEKIKHLLIPKDPDDNKNVIIEIKSGTGGDEACIFVEDIYRMLTMYFKTRKWKIEIINSNSGNVAGFREISVRNS